MATKQLSITIEEEQYEDIKKFIKLTTNLNVSKVINIALKELFSAESEYARLINELKDNAILIPIKRYVSLFATSEKTVLNNIKSGKIQHIKIGATVYIKLNTEDEKNIYYQIVLLKEETEKLYREIERIKEKVQM